MVNVKVTHFSGITLFKVLSDNRTIELRTEDAIRISNIQGNDEVWAWIASGLKLTKHEEKNIIFLNENNDEFVPKVYEIRKKV